jgi:hypothetical protein
MSAPASSVTGVINLMKYFEDLPLGESKLLSQHRERFSTALILQLQLRHVHWLMSVQSTGDSLSQDAAPIIETN